MIGEGMEIVNEGFPEDKYFRACSRVISPSRNDVSTRFDQITSTIKNKLFISLFRLFACQNRPHRQNLLHDIMHALRSMLIHVIINHVNVD
jgi:hypothetical protein